jgi:hypothetical protein
MRYFSVFTKLNGFCRALLDTGPAFDAVFGVDRNGLIALDLIYLARADLDAVFASGAFLFVYNRIHRNTGLMSEQVNELLSYYFFAPVDSLILMACIISTLCAMRLALCVYLISRLAWFRRPRPGRICSRFGRW